MEASADSFSSLKFVQIVEKYKVLYDHTLEDYSNRQIQEKTWKQVGNEFNETGASCKERWKNIRSAYSRFLRQKPASGSAATLKKKYYLADYLSFLMPFTKSRQQKSSIPSPKNINEEIDNSTQEDYDNVNAESEVQELDGENQNAEETLNIINENQTPTPKINRKRKEVDPLEKCAMDYFTFKKSKVDNEKPEDADFLFLKSLLPDLHIMTNSQKHEFKCKTMQTIGDILYKSPINQSRLNYNYNSGYHTTVSSIRPSSQLSQAPSTNSYPSTVNTPLQSPNSTDYEFVTFMPQ